MLKVSIIIPVFKVEPYIERCVCSVLNQTYRELEVILIDDCSPDHSLDIAKQVVEKSEKSRDLDFVFLKHEKNRGLSAARNTGIKAATGDYFYLLDSDDEITPVCIEKLISLVIKHPNVDLVQGNTWCNKKGYEWMDISKKHFPEYTDDTTWIKKQLINIDYNLRDFLPVNSCNKLIRRTLFSENNLWFKEGLIHEDEHWRLMSRNYIKSIAFCNDITYNYYLRENSIVTSSPKKDKRYHAFLEIYKDYIPTIGDYPNEDIKKIFVRLLTIRKDYAHVDDMSSIEKHYLDVLKKIIKSKSLNIRIKFALLYLMLPSKVVKFRILNKLL